MVKIKDRNIEMCFNWGGGLKEIIQPGLGQVKDNKYKRNLFFDVRSALDWDKGLLNPSCIYVSVIQKICMLRLIPPVI